MATITGTKLGARLLEKDSSVDGGVRETWLVTASFGAYTASSDDAELAGVGAFIDAKARDGKTRTLRGAVPCMGGDNGSGTVVYFSGASVQALTVSSDDLTGELNNKALTETNAAAGTEVGVAVIVDRE